ncbi:MAG: MFS transporter [Acidimicrobiia bacterium]|nr:MFS transporter [Acidimicrobiia bacterium]
MLLISFVSTATNIAVPALEDAFEGRPLSTISWVVTAFNVSQVTLMLVGGRLADRRGRKLVFLSGMAVFALGALASALAPSLGVLIAARVAQAVGAALVLPASLVAVLPSYPPEQHATVVSLWSSMGVVGATLAPTISAALLTVGGWRSVFAIAVPIALGGLVLGWRVLPDSRPERRPGPLDVVGAVAGTVVVGALAFGLVQGRVWGWTSPWILAAALAAVGSAAVFAHRARTHPEPLLDLRIFQARTFSAPAAAATVQAVGGAATWFIYPLFMKEIWGFSLFQIGLGMSPGALTMVLVTLVAGRIADRRGYRSLLLVGSSIVVAGVGWMALFLVETNPYVFGFLPGTSMIGIGMGLTVGPMNSAALRSVGDAMLGAANAAFNTLRFFGSAMGVALAAALLGNTAGRERAEAFHLALIVVTAVVALGPLILAVGYPSDRRRGAAPVSTGRDVAATPWASRARPRPVPSARRRASGTRR